METLSAIQERLKYFLKYEDWSDIITSTFSLHSTESITQILKDHMRHYTTIIFGKNSNWPGVFLTAISVISILKLIRKLIQRRLRSRLKSLSSIQIRPSPSEQNVTCHVPRTMEQIASVRTASEAFLTIDLYNGDVVSFPALIHSNDPGEVDIERDMYKPVIQSLDGEYGGCINVVEALELSKMVHLVYVLPDDQMIAFPIVL